MRRNYIKTVCAGLVVAAACMLSSCNDDLHVSLPSKPRKIEVGILAGGAQTRTEMLPNGLSATWTDGDRLSVWAKTTAGSFALSNQVFDVYGHDAGRGFFTSTLDAAMPETDYTYYCCYPVPVSANGTKVTFDLPSEQDGKASGGADIMIATPVRHGALLPIADPDDHSGMSMVMNRMMHQFRFWLPEGYNPMAEDIEEIVVTMPQEIAGVVSADVSDPSAGLSLVKGTNTLRLALADPIGESASFETASFACAAVLPFKGTYTESDYMELVLYSQTYKATLEPVSLAGRTFAPGHSTPVMLLPKSVDEYYRLSMKVGENHIGEGLDNVTILFNGTPWYSYSNTEDEAYGNFTHVAEALGAEGKEAYDLILSSITSGTATYIYETEHALVNRPLTPDMMTYDGNRIELDLGDVPYLLYEDFTDASVTAHDDVYTPGLNSDTNLKGYLLDGYMPWDGWNAARFSILEGDCVRINCRYQSGSWVVGRYCGRLDTPALKYLKEGVSVNVRVEFDEAFDVPAGYNRDDSTTPMAKYHVGTHTRSQTSAINGQNSNDLSGEATILYTSGLHADEDVSVLNPASLTISSVGPATRIVWFVDTDRTTSVIAANAVYYLYLDNIRVYIDN